MLIYKVTSPYYFGSLVFILFLYVPVWCMTVWKRMEGETNHPGSSDIDAVVAANLLLQLSQPTGSQERTKEKPKDEENGIKRKRVDPEEKRLKKLEIRRLLHQKVKEDYLNRFQFPSDSEERKKIEEKHDQKAKKNRERASRNAKLMYDRIRSGTATAADLKRSTYINKIAKNTREKRAKRIQEGKGTQKDFEYRKRRREQQASYQQRRKVRREQNHPGNEAQR